MSKSILKTGLKRDTIDKFYTHPSIASECVKLIATHIKIDKEIDIVIEPSAGNGSFITEIRTLSNNCLFYDIEPESHEICKQDYLSLELGSLEMPHLHTKIHVIGNPPFGRQSTLAIQFIKKSASVADSISFILPKSFKKDSMMRHFPTNFHLVYQVDVADNSFLMDNQVKNVPCVFQVWQKREETRVAIIKETADPNIYQFVKRDEEPDISFRRVGVNAGVIDDKDLDKNLNKKSIETHYFIKFGQHVDKIELINKIKQIKYETNNTVGPKSICKQEIIREINKIIHF
jgi:predicted RNA methylase